MSKRGRKRRARKKSGANHGKRPNAWGHRRSGAVPEP
jgi:hypothetical protein